MKRRTFVCHLTTAHRMENRTSECFKNAHSIIINEFMNKLLDDRLH